MAEERWILHADMDAFFASVEQRDHPELRGKPVIVGGTGDRGVVSAASYEARVFGVRSAMPGYRARALCPDGVFLPGDMKKYAKESQRIHEIFGAFTDQIEPLALDEAFLDISGSLRLLGEPLTIGRALKDRVRQERGLAVSVGIAPNKLVAKIACNEGKPDGLRLVRREQIAESLAPLSIGKLWGVGPKAEQRLVTLGIRTFGDLAQSSPKIAALVFGRFALEMIQRARGVDERPVESERAPRSIGEEATFGEDVTDLERLRDAIVVHAEAVAARARRAGYEGRTITLKVKFSGRRRGDGLAVHELFESHTRQKSLASATASGKLIASVAHELLGHLERKRPLRLLGVSLGGLVKLPEPEGALLEEGALERRAARAEQLELRFVESSPTPAEPTRPDVGSVLDLVNQKFGGGTLRRAVEAVEKLSPHDRAKLGEDPS
jgi:DNA polymerase IV